MTLEIDYGLLMPPKKHLLPLPGECGTQGLINSRFCGIMRAMDSLRPIGLVAIPREAQPLVSVLSNRVEERWGETTVHRATVVGCPVALAEVPPGPVNAALGAQALISRCGISALVSFGSAGALNPVFRTGDLLIAERAVVHDAGVFLGSRFDPTGIVGRDESGRIGYRRDFEASPAIVALAVSSAQSLGKPVRIGTVATGNQVVLASGRNRYLRHTFGAEVVDMETAAVAQVAVAHRLPWGAVRAISDSASDDYILDYSRLRVYLDDGQPAWQQRLTRLLYLVTHPRARRRLDVLLQGLSMAAEQAAGLMEAMLGSWETTGVGVLESQ
jgi:5'-methylthioadenosine/S-adenosylhomocysteine nucleosidase